MPLHATFRDADLGRNSLIRLTFNEKHENLLLAGRELGQLDRVAVGLSVLPHSLLLWIAREEDTMSKIECTSAYTWPGGCSALRSSPRAWLARRPPAVCRCDLSSLEGCIGSENQGERKARRSSIAVRWQNPGGLTSPRSLRSGNSYRYGSSGEGRRLAHCPSYRLLGYVGAAARVARARGRIVDRDRVMAMCGRAVLAASR